MRMGEDTEMLLRDKEGISTTAEAYDRQMLLALICMAILFYLYYQLTSW